MNLNLNLEVCLFCQSEKTVNSLPCPLVPDLQTLCKFLRIQYPEHIPRQDNNNSIENLFRHFMGNLNEVSAIKWKSVNPKLCLDCLADLNRVEVLYRNLDIIVMEIVGRARSIRKIISDENPNRPRTTGQQQGYLALKQMFKDFVRNGVLDPDLSTLNGNVKPNNSQNVSQSFLNVKSSSQNYTAAPNPPFIHVTGIETDIQPQLKEHRPCFVPLKRIIPPSLQFNKNLERDSVSTPSAIIPTPTTIADSRVNKSKDHHNNFPMKRFSSTFENSSDPSDCGIEQQCKVEESGQLPDGNVTPEDCDMDENEDVSMMNELTMYKVKKEEDEEEDYDDEQSAILPDDPLGYTDTADNCGLEEDPDEYFEQSETGTCSWPPNRINKSTPTSSNFTKNKIMGEDANEHKYYICRYCQEKLPSISNYYNHRYHAHPEEFETISKLSFLSETVINGKFLSKWQCNICSNMITSGNALDLMEHLLSHDDDEHLSDAPPGAQEEPFGIRYYCDECDCMFNKAVNLDLHKLCFHESIMNGIKCDVCGGSESKTRDELILHIKSHGLNVMSCKTCPISFSSLDNFLKHVEVHSWSNRLPCPKCNLILPSIYHVRTHCYEKHLQQIVKSQQSSDGRLLCPHCPDRAFKNYTTLENHTKIFHTSDESKRFKCSHCGKRYVHNVTLQEHVKQIHLKIRFSCRLCPKSFSSKSLFREHEELHAGGGPPVLTCHICKGTYSSKAVLKLHTKAQHSGSGPVNCHVCGKECKNIISLRTHKFKWHSSKNNKKQNRANDDVNNKGDLAN